MNDRLTKVTIEENVFVGELIDTFQLGVKAKAIRLYDCEGNGFHHNGDGYLANHRAVIILNPKDKVETVA